MNILLLHTGNLTIQSIQFLYTDLMSYSDRITLTPVGLPTTKGKSTAAQRKEWINNNLSVLNSTDFILVADGEYFKQLTNLKKVMPYLGTPCQSKFTSATILYSPNPYKYTINQQEFLEQQQTALDTLEKLLNGNTVSKEVDTVELEYYPKSIEEIADFLNQLKNYPELTLDIESKGIKLSDADIYTISFAWNKYSGGAFPVEAHSEPEKIKELLIKFFESYNGKLIVHKANYDFMVIIWNLWQKKDFSNIKGQLKGISVLGKNFDDTLLITYLATNSCAGNTLSLKELGAEFAGDWAVDVSDVIKVDLDTLLKYNFIDCRSTWFVKEKYEPIMIADGQQIVYEAHFKPYLLDCIRMQLNGSPINAEGVNNLENILNQKKDEVLSFLVNTKEVKDAEIIIAEKLADKKNATYVKKHITWEDVYKPLNFNSGTQVSCLLYEVMGLPVIERTKTKQPATGKDVLEKLINHTQNETHKKILQALIDYADAEKILSAFLPAFKNPSVDSKGVPRLTGYFNLGGTKSGRMSSSNINLQQLPSSGSIYSKPVKECFVSSDEWLFVGYDFASLEDKIDALKTRDTNKLKVYLEGYDGHCLRAYAYFKDQMPNIELAAPNEQCYTVKVGDKLIDLKETQLIRYKGQILTGKQLYEQIHKVKS